MARGYTNSKTLLLFSISILVLSCQDEGAPSKFGTTPEGCIDLVGQMYATPFFTHQDLSENQDEYILFMPDEVFIQSDSQSVQSGFYEPTCTENNLSIALEQNTYTIASDDEFNSIFLVALNGSPEVAIIYDLVEL